MVNLIMKKLFEKHETLFCILLITIYVVINSFCVQNFGFTSLAGFIVNTVLSLLLIGLIFALNGTSYYGLVAVKDSKKYLYFIPLIIIATVNLWNGININSSKSEILFHILTMINIGFIEEIIFRGFLFKMMERQGVKGAIHISAITFGIGHIVNLLNGAELIPTLIQICYAVSIGYLFVIIFIKSKSLIPCIITHSVTNALSIFNVDNELSMYIAPIALTVVPIIYAIYITRSVKE
jgi:membrane protease YdiL (CAAX protease family)